MPFMERPEGFSSETLDLLDRAIMQMYLDHLADRQLKLAEAVARAAEGEDPAAGIKLMRS
jgi:hypothetical protein